MGEMSIFTQEEFEKYKEINSSLKQITKEKVEKTQNKGLCFWCEKRKAEFPKQNPQLCPECFVSPLKDMLEDKAHTIQLNLKMLKAMPSHYANKYEERIIQMIKQGEKLGNFFEEK